MRLSFCVSLVALLALGHAACGPTGSDPDAGVGDAVDASTSNADAATQADARPPDNTPPTVSLQMPAAGEEHAIGSTIEVTFSEPMDKTTITASSDGTCSGSVQLSADDFSSCISFPIPTSKNADATFALAPTSPLDTSASYLLRVTTSASDKAGNGLVAQYQSSAPFTVRYARSVTIDGNNDFSSTDNQLASTNAGLWYLSYDDNALYAALADVDVGAGSGNKFLYLLFSTDSTLQTGNPASSDAKAIFGQSGARMMYHWKERIAGGNYSEFRSGNGADWETDWSQATKQVFKGAGFVEVSIPWADFGGMPAELSVTMFVIDYDGDAPNGYLYNLLPDATPGGAATPVDLFQYVRLELPSGEAPADPSHLSSF